jgi:hypothetical protein
VHRFTNSGSYQSEVGLRAAINQLDSVQQQADEVKAMVSPDSASSCLLFASLVIQTLSLRHSMTTPQCLTSPPLFPRINRRSRS